jgi:hypothetical protein
MLKFTVASVGLALIAIASPATAQNYPSGAQAYGNGYGNGNASARIGQLQTRLQEGVRSGAINRQEALPLRQQLRDLIRLNQQYAYNGYTGQETSTLQQRIRSIRQQLRQADGGAQGRYAQSDLDDGYTNHGYASGRIDSNNDGWDDRDYNRNGRLDDDAVAYPQQAPRSGLGGLIDSVLGRSSLQVGQRASANLSAVPYQLQSQYRDGGGFYFRSDGRNVYQIDARTQVVVRVFPV